MRSRSARLWQFVALTVFGLAAASAFMMMSVGARSGAQSSPAARLGRRIGEIPAIAKPEAFQGYLSGTESIPMIISFEPRNQGALQKLLADLYSRGSEQYHHWISAKEFGSRFGRTEAEFNRAESWLKDQGFEIDQAFDNRLDIAFTGTADAVQRAFSVQMGRYWDAANNRSFYSNMQSPNLPPDIYGMTQGLEGLSDGLMYHTHARYQRRTQPVPASRKASAGGKAEPAGFLGGPPAFMAPADLAVAYDFQPFFDQNLFGQGQKAGIVIDSDVKDSDVALFRSTFGLPGANLVRRTIKGLKKPGINNGGVGEAILDISSISTVAPMAEIDLVLIPSLSFVNIRRAEQAIVNDGTIPVVNESFGACETESFNLAEQATFEQGLTEGIAFFASSGDEGAECSNDIPGQRNVQCPACYFEVTAAGGTQIDATFDQNTGALLSIQDEQVWNSPPGDIQGCGGSEAAFPAGATGGGFCKLVGLPAYQALAQQFTGGVPPSTTRVVPDAALLSGVPFTVSFINGDAFNFIGTSQASPLMVGMETLLNQFNGGPVGLLNGTLYQFGVSQYNGSLPGSFFDITVGNNTVLPRQPCDPTGVTGFSAGFGFDPVTGWGSPELAAFVNNVSKFGSEGIFPQTGSGELIGNTLTVSGTTDNSSGRIAGVDIVLIDGSGVAIAETGPQPFGIGAGNPTSFVLPSINNMGDFPTALVAIFAFTDNAGNQSFSLAADFSEADSGGPTINTVNLASANGPLTITGAGFNSSTQLEVNGVIIGSIPIKVKGGGTKLKIAASAATLGINTSGPNRIRVLNGSLKSNIVVIAPR